MKIQLPRPLRRTPLRVLLTVLGLLTLSSTQATPPTGYTLVWEDDFDTYGPPKGGVAAANALSGSGLWNAYTSTHSHRENSTEGWENLYTPDALYLDGSNLILRCYTPTPDVPIHHSYGIDSKGKIPSMQLFGYMEAKIQIEPGTSTLGGTTSSFWMNSARVDAVDHGGPLDPHNNGVEMDILEYHPRNGANQVISAYGAQSGLHWDGYVYGPTGHHKMKTYGPYNARGILNSATYPIDNGDFHTYSLEWTPDMLTFKVDGYLIWQVANNLDVDPSPEDAGGPVPHRAEHFLLSIELFGTWTGNVPTGTGYGAKGDSKNPRMIVDYIKVYQKPLKLLNKSDPSNPTPPTMRLDSVSGSSGQMVSQNTWTGAPSQYWTINYEGTASDGITPIYSLFSKAAGKDVVLAVPGGNMVPDQDLVQYNRSTSSTQRWKFKNRNDGYGNFTITNVATDYNGNSFNLAASGTNAGNAVELATPSSSDGKQKWVPKEAP